MDLGEASALIDLATVAMHARRTDSVARVAAGEAISQADVLRNRRDIALAADQLRAGVQKLVEICGSRIVYDTDPLQLLLRDVLTITTHSVVNRHMSFAGYGQHLLGVSY
jgi:hypothetical protein